MIQITLGKSGVQVPPLGLGVMVWGVATGLQRLMPAKTAYGGANAADEQSAFDTSLAAGVNFFDTAAMYSGGGSEHRLGELAQDTDVVIATKFPPSPLSVQTICRLHWTRVWVVCDARQLTYTSTTFRRAGWTSNG
jgi:aryl-alcohol dehydrogenase-like predicted oxidoreductase